MEILNEHSLKMNLPVDHLHKQHILLHILDFGILVYLLIRYNQIYIYIIYIYYLLFRIRIRNCHTSSQTTCVESSCCKCPCTIT